MTATRAVHPARWSPQIIDVLWGWLSGAQMPVHDPFAGTGERLGEVCDGLGLPFTGTEIEPEFIVDPRVQVGDSTDPGTYPAPPFCVCTSPAYPNGMADHFRSLDGSHRNTYRQAIADVLGYDRPLHDNNMGRHSVRNGSRAIARHLAIADAALRWWPETCIVNVSDFVHKRSPGGVYPYVTRWRELLDRHGYRIVLEREVDTPRQRFGANGHLRVDHEMVFIDHRGHP